MMKSKRFEPIQEIVSSSAKDPSRPMAEAANKVARAIVILGEDEVASGILTVKHFASGEQFKVPRAQLAEKLASLPDPPTSN